MELNEIFRTSAITTLVIIMVQFLKVAKAKNNAWFAIAFTASVVCYLIVEGSITEINAALLSILVIGPFLLPLLFWLLSKSIFDDSFKMQIKYYVFILIYLIIPYLSFYYHINTPASPHVKNVILLIPKLFSVVFMSLGVLEAIRNRKFDLIDARLRFRNTFILITASLIGITLIVESIEISYVIPAKLPTIQKAAIFLLALSFIYFNTELNLGFFIRTEKEKAEPAIDSSPQIAEKISKLLIDEKIYRKEGLTIGQLAEMLKEQEYRVRRTINGQLGFRNFNDFLNQYRVQEACTILQDAQKANLTILEIAYALGYKSIGPFNKAFKDQTGLTPTAFRKQSLR
jgi:AraC-like DNA-binding protein